MQNELDTLGELAGKQLTESKPADLFESMDARLPCKEREPDVSFFKFEEP